MIALFCLCLVLFASPFKSKGRLEAENAALGDHFRPTCLAPIVEPFADDFRGGPVVAKHVVQVPVVESRKSFTAESSP
jgi:hypothetical protein